MKFFPTDKRVNGYRVVAFFKPGVDLVTRFLPMFYVPAIVVLPLSARQTSTYPPSQLPSLRPFARLSSACRSVCPHLSPLLPAPP